MIIKLDSDQGNQLHLLYDYSGGPGSTLGVGKTNINLYLDQRTGLNNPQLAGSATDNTNQFKGSLVASGSFDYSVFHRPQRNVSIITKGSKNI